MSYLRTTCEHCNESIEFPEHGIGEAIECPHCSRELILKKPKLLGLKGWMLVLLIQLFLIIPLYSFMFFKAVEAEVFSQAAKELGWRLTIPDDVMGAVRDRRMPSQEKRVYMRDGYFFRQVDLAFFGVAAIAAGIQICRRKPSAYMFVRVFMGGAIILGIVTLLFSSMPDRRAQIAFFKILCVWVCIWWIYFERSKRVRMTLSQPQETPKTTDLNAS